jgi:selenocysteine lyase/cysteine desulfurase
MKANISSIDCTDQPKQAEEAAEAFADLERSVYAALETYSNVHRGSGHYSLATTELYEYARQIVLDFLGADPSRCEVIFCSPRRAALLEARLAPGTFRRLSSQALGLPLGVRALVVDRAALPGGAPLQVGGGTARLVSPNWVLWAKAPDRFEAGTPAIINVIAFARALQLAKQAGKNVFRDAAPEALSAADILYRDELESFAGQELLDALRQTLVGRSVHVPTMAGNSPFINLDNGASTPTFAPIWEAACHAWHLPTPAQGEIPQQVRSICARVLGAPLATYDVIYTSNTTEAINLAAENLGKAPFSGIQPVIVNTLLEHNSNELPWRRIPGVSQLRLPVDLEGFIDLNSLETLLSAYNQDSKHGKQRITLVAVSGASNVLGTFNDLAEISRIVHRHGASLLVDAAQLVAHRKIDMESSGIDYLAFSAHKAYAPFGCGVLLARKNLLNFSPAELEQIQAFGDENVTGIAALGKALLLLERIGLDLIQAEEQALTSQALHGLSQVPGLKIYGIQDPESPRFARKGGVIPFNLKPYISYQVAQKLAEQSGIGVRAGCHCAHLLVKHMLHIPPWLQQAQGLLLSLFPHLNLPGVARVSLGIENSPAEIDDLIQALDQIARQTPDPMGNPFADPKKSRAPKTAIQQKMEGFSSAIVQKVYPALP